MGDIACKAGVEIGIGLDRENASLLRMVSQVGVCVRAQKNPTSLDRSSVDRRRRHRVLVRNKTRTGFVQRPVV